MIVVYQERLEARETRVAELEARAAALESQRASSEAALQSAARRVRDLQEECAALRTRAHQHHAHALQLQASLADAQVTPPRQRRSDHYRFEIIFEFIYILVRPLSLKIYTLFRIEGHCLYFLEMEKVFLKGSIC